MSRLPDQVPADAPEAEADGALLTTSPEILGGKLCIAGTRISVEHVAELLSAGGDESLIRRAESGRHGAPDRRLEAEQRAVGRS